MSYVTYIRDQEMNEDKTRIGRPFPKVGVCLNAGRLLVNTAFGVIRTGKRQVQGTTPIRIQMDISVLTGEKMISVISMAGKISAVRVEQAVLNFGNSRTGGCKTHREKWKGLSGCMDHSKRKKFISRIAGNPPVVKKYFIRRRNPQVCLFSGCFSGK